MPCVNNKWPCTHKIVAKGISGVLSPKMALILSDFDSGLGAIPYMAADPSSFLLKKPMPSFLHDEAA